MGPTDPLTLKMFFLFEHGDIPAIAMVALPEATRNNRFLTIWKW